MSIRRLALALSVILACATSKASEPLIVFISSARTVDEAVQMDLPNYRRLLNERGSAAMVCGVFDGDPLGSLFASEYAPLGPHDIPDANPVPARERIRSSWLAKRLGGPDSIFFIDKVQDREFFASQLAEAVVTAKVIVIAPFDLAPGTSLFTEDAILGALMRSLPRSDIIVLNPWPSHVVKVMGRAQHVPSWIAVSWTEGALTSDTSRTAGLVHNLDIAPTILQRITGKEAGDAYGRPLRSTGSDLIPSSGAYNAHLLQAGVRTITDLTTRAIAWFAGLGVAFLVIGTILSFPRIRPPNWVRVTVRVGFIAILLTPVADAWSASRFPETPVEFTIGAVISLTGLVGISFLLSCLFKTSVISLAALIAALYVAVGAVLPGPALGLRLSPLGCLYSSGVRLYGLGNEHVAFFLSFALFALLLSRRQEHKRGGFNVVSLAIWLVMICLAVGSPFAGANFGGMISAVAAGVVVWSLTARHARIRVPWLWALLVGVVLVVNTVRLDMRSAHPTHVGCFAQRLTEYDGSTVDILTRKALMNLGLLASPVTIPAAVGAILLVWLCAGPLKPTRQRAVHANPGLGTATISLLTGGVVAALVNDTGILMLAIIAGELAVAWVYMMVDSTNAPLRSVSPAGTL